MESWEAFAKTDVDRDLRSRCVQEGQVELLLLLLHIDVIRKPVP